MRAEVRGGVLAPGKYGVFCENLKGVPVINLIPRRRI